jgi:hypothetical protein
MAIERKNGLICFTGEEQADLRDRLLAASEYMRRRQTARSCRAWVRVFSVLGALYLAVLAHIVLT